MTSRNLTMFSCLKSSKIATSRSVVTGTPSSCASRRIFFNATMLSSGGRSIEEEEEEEEEEEGPPPPRAPLVLLLLPPPPAGPLSLLLLLGSMTRAWLVAAPPLAKGDSCERCGCCAAGDAGGWMLGSRAR